MKISSFNVNSIRARLEKVLRWIENVNPDIVCMQEIKCINQAFPYSVFEDMGYNIAVNGQKTYNGVAILSKLPLEKIYYNLSDVDIQARYLEVEISLPDNGFLRVANVYVPNGNPIGSDKFVYKLKWLDMLIARAERLLEYEENLIIAGDYNIIPGKADVYDPAGWEKDALFVPIVREKFHHLLYMGFTDALKAKNVADYTFWAYRGNAWNNNHGLRIDHMLLSPQAADKLQKSVIDKYLRNETKCSDHVPLWVQMDI